MCAVALRLRLEALTVYYPKRRVMLSFPTPQRTMVLCGLLTVALMFHAFVNILLPRIPESTSNKWRYVDSIPVGKSVGVDFKTFRNASQEMVSGKSPYNASFQSPPFTALVFYPLTLTPENTAYRIQLFLLSACNIASLILLACLMQRASSIVVGEASSVIPLVLITVSVLQFLGYPFEFSLERGNYDAFALFFIVMGLWFAAQNRKNLWLPVLFFSVATHLKVYSGIFFVIPLWQHRQRAMIPLVLTNVAMLFVFGAKRVLEFSNGLRQFSLHPYFWMGNHSAASFADQFFGRFLLTASDKRVHLVAMTLLLGIPIAIWLHGSIRLIRRGFDVQAMLLWAALSTPIMCITTPVSHDYRLIICALPTIICLIYFANNFVYRGSRLDFIATVGTLVPAVLIARSIMYSPILWGNKYPVLILLEICAYLAVCMKTSVCL